MMKLVAGLFVIGATILGQIVGYNTVQTVMPQYLTMYVIAIVFTWLGLLANAMAD